MLNAHKKSTNVLATSGIPVHAGKTRAGSTSPLNKCNRVTPNSDVAEQPNTLAKLARCIRATALHRATHAHKYNDTQVYHKFNNLKH